MNNGPSVTYTHKGVYEFRNETLERRVASLERENAKLRSQLRNSMRKAGWRKHVKKYVPYVDVSSWSQLIMLLTILAAMRNDEGRRTTLAEIVSLCEYKTESVIVPDSQPMHSKQRSARYLLWEFPPAEGGWEDTDFEDDTLWCFHRVGTLAATWLAELCEEDPDA